MTVTSEMAGTIVSINVVDDSVVNAGQVLLYVESMKMEIPVLAPVGGTVKFLGIQVGAAVAPGEALMNIG